MPMFHSLTLRPIMFAILTFNGTLLGAQANSKVNHAPILDVSIALEPDHVQVGQSPWAALTITNVSGDMVTVPSDISSYHFHVEENGAEAPKTEFHRHLNGEFRRGDKEPQLSSGPVISHEIAPGKSYVRRFQLTRYYDLGNPGKYSVYVEVKDQLDHWVRSNTATLDVVPKPQ
jgi:hypothetical protein